MDRIDRPYLRRRRIDKVEVRSDQLLEWHGDVHAYQSQRPNPGNRRPNPRWIDIEGARPRSRGPAGRSAALSHLRRARR